MESETLKANPANASQTKTTDKGFKLRSGSSYKIDPLACAYCAKCHSICPTYLPTKNEGYSARGKILLYSAIRGDFRSVVSSHPQARGHARSLASAEAPPLGIAPEDVLSSSRLLDYLDFCTRCYRCSDVCPAGMATVPIFEKMRFELAKHYPPSLPLRLLMRELLPKRTLTRAISALAQFPFSLAPFLARRVYLSRRLKDWLYSLSKYEALFCSLNSGSPTVSFLGRRFTVPESQLRRAQIFQFAQKFQTLQNKCNARSPQNSIALFADCLSDIYYPGIFFSAVKVLNRLGYRVLIPPSPSCCGASALNTGDYQGFARMAKNFIRCFKDLRDSDGKTPQAILFVNPTCFKTVKERYLEVLSADEVSLLPEPRLDIDFILPKLKEAGISAKDSAISEIPLAWHNPCSVSYALGLKAEEFLGCLTDIGLKLREFKEVEGCCGFGGLFSTRFPQRAFELSAEKHETWRENGVELVLSSSAGCISHLNAVAIGLNKSAKHKAGAENGLYPPAVHFLEILSRLR